MNKDWMGWVFSLLSGWDNLALIMPWLGINFWSGKETDLIMGNTLDRKPEFWLTTVGAATEPVWELSPYPSSKGTQTRG